MPEHFERPMQSNPPDLPEPKVIKLPLPPESKTDYVQSALQLTLPVLSILGYLALAATGQRSGGLMLPMGISILATTLLGLYAFIRKIREERAAEDCYRLRLRDHRDAMMTYHRQQRDYFNFVYPNIDTLYNIVEGTVTGYGNVLRVYERRPSDPNFAALALGPGTQPSLVTYQLPEDYNPGDPRISEVIRLAAESEYVTDIPVTVSLRKIHSLGVAGYSADSYIRALLMQLTTLHAPTEAQLYVVAARETRERWEWAEALPHIRPVYGSGDKRLAFEENAVSRLLKSIEWELGQRQRWLNDFKDEPINFPFLLLVVDIEDTASRWSVLGKPAISLIFEHGPELGAAVIFVCSETHSIPGQCQAKLELDADNHFRYAEAGVNSIRYTGTVEIADRQRAEDEFVVNLAQYRLLETGSATLPNSISFLNMHSVENVDALMVQENWDKSRDPAHADWARAVIGMRKGGELRELVFSANGDGNHGIIAGTTGSGKTELLLTLIMSLAARYDPTMVNFVLVDYKGGAGFSPITRLKHKVDLITNLSAAKAMRAFVAFRAELDRRSKLMADTSYKDIVEYNRNREKHGGDTLPFLFIIIDEFSELIKLNPDFRGQLESITRLGRSIGVHLILAAQQPAGFVSDQMRANMNFRICLRVRDAADSRELIGRPDAAKLRGSGHALIQIGNESIEEIQVGHIGGPYTGEQTQVLAAAIWHNRPRPAMKPSTENFPSTCEVLVEYLHNLKAVEPKKPWYDALPLRLPLHTLGIAPEQPVWDNADWKAQSMVARIGLVDHPAKAQQFPLTLDFTRGHVVVFGGPGYGKTSFLRTLILSLAATNTPEMLHIYGLDFGGGLQVLAPLPHVSAIISPSESNADERVKRLIRRLTQELEHRKKLFGAARVDSLNTYNQQEGLQALPAILLVVDNFAAFQNYYEEAGVNAMILLAREGRAYGIHMTVTAEMVNALPGKLLTMFTTRLALKLTDPSEYMTAIGRSVPGSDDVVGRGFFVQEQKPREFQTAVPLGTLWRADEVDSYEPADDLQVIYDLSNHLSEVWGDQPRPDPVGILPEHIPLEDIIDLSAEGAVVGINDYDLKSASITLSERRPHFIVVGSPYSGKTTALTTLAVSLAYVSQKAHFCLIDFRGPLYDALKDMPGVLHAADIEQTRAMIASLRESPQPDTYVFIDNYEDLMSAGMNARESLAKDMADLARRGVHFVISGTWGSSFRNTGDDLLKQLTVSVYSLILDATSGAFFNNVSLPRFDLPPGRAYLLQGRQVGLIQIATANVSQVIELIGSNNLHETKG